MNIEQIANPGSTIGQRLRMAAVKVGEVIGLGGLLTIAAVEASAALNFDTPMVQEAEAGTGIQGVVISGGCNPSSNQPQLTIRNNTLVRLDFRASINDGPFGFAGTVEPNNSLTGSATAGDKYVHTADQIPGARDTEVIPACGTTTTASPATSTPPTSTTVATNNQNTGGSIPIGEVGVPVAQTGTTTTLRASGDTTPGTNLPTGNEETSNGQQTAATTSIISSKPATPSSGRMLALTGNETGAQAATGVGLAAAGGLLVYFSRRKRQQISV